MAFHADDSTSSIVDLLRRQIVEGRFAPGARLPTRTDLMQRHRVCSASLQKAQDLLKSEGFLHARPKLGTFVTEHPPHLYHIGLLFDSNPALPQWSESSRFHYALGQEAQALTRRGPFRIRTWTGAADDLAQLRACLRDRRLAGLLVTNPYLHHALVRAAGIPCVAFTGSQLPRGLLHVQMDPRGFIERALDALGSAQRRRVAIITAATTSTTTIEHLMHAAAARGLSAQIPWVQGVPLSQPQWARHAVRAMFGGPANERPDSLIISDEHLIDSALVGLLDEGLKIPADVEVVGHANHGWSAPSAVPIHRLGYVVRDLLAHAVELIDGSNRGRQLAQPLVVEPLLEKEWKLRRALESAPAGELETARQGAADRAGEPL